MTWLLGFIKIEPHNGFKKFKNLATYISFNLCFLTLHIYPTQQPSERPLWRPSNWSKLRRIIPIYEVYRYDIPGNLSLLSWSKLRSERCWTSHRRDCKAPQLPRHSGGSIGPSVGLRTWKKTRYEYNNKKFCVMMLQSLKAHSYRVLVFCDKRSHIYNL